jgi:hypothetical protein
MKPLTNIGYGQLGAVGGGYLGESNAQQHRAAAQLQAPTPISPMDAAMHENERAIYALNDVVGALESRLSGIMTPTNAAGAASSPPPSSGSAIREGIIRQTLAIQSVYGRLRDMLDRLEV